MKLQLWRKKRSRRLRWKHIGAASKKRNCPAGDPKCSLEMEDNDMKETSYAWSMWVERLNVTRWRHKWGFHTRGVMWDTPLAKWAGNGDDRFQKINNAPPAKKRVVQSCTRSFHS